jgi:hypothetical protein
MLEVMSCAMHIVPHAGICVYADPVRYASVIAIFDRVRAERGAAPFRP